MIKCLLKEFETPFPSMTSNVVNHNSKSLIINIALFRQCFCGHC